MKRLVFCFDGTWNKIDSKHPTNVARVAQAISPRAGETLQVIHYDEGVGTSFLDRKLGGATGYGMSENIAEAYHFLVLNYEPGDEIFAFGFSRGAFTARSFVGLIRNCGIISRRHLDKIAEAVSLYQSRKADSHPDSERMLSFRFATRPDLCLPGDREWRQKTQSWREGDSHDLTVSYLGVWDSVASLGIPAQLRLLAPWVNRKYQFHDARLSGFVKAARHAVAADEKRNTFAPSLWTNLHELNPPTEVDPPYQQMIFPGPHGGVGGGGSVTGLSDGALNWVLRGALKQGLVFDMDDLSPLYGLKPDHRAQLFNQDGKSKWSFGDRAMGFGLKDRDFSLVNVTNIHASLLRRYKEGEGLPGGAYRPKSLGHLHDAIEQRIAKLDREFEDLPGDPVPGIEMVDIRPYTVEDGDTLQKIAKAEMGDTSLWPILFKHNRRNNILFDKDELWVGETIEIPVYQAKTDAEGGATDAAPAPQVSL